MEYKGFIWTNHIIDRLKDRKIPQGLVVQAIQTPDSTFEKDGATQYQKQLGKQKISVIVKKNERNESIILSAWVNPPNPGTADFREKKRYQASKKASFIKKFWFTFLNQVGL